MTLTKAQKKAVLEVLEGSKANANHSLVHSDTDQEREFYRGLVARADTLIPLFKGPDKVEVEEDEEEDEVE